MKLPRDVDGAVLVELLCRHFGYRKVHQVGSHIVIQCDSRGITASRYRITPRSASER
jgi:predicted RNA binding protein YcfA (HicA-like mRNA interferase family)